jgi:hypothetical protein
VLGNILIRDVLELTWRIHEFLPDLVGQLDCRDEIANAKTKAHRDISSLVILHEGEMDNRGSRRIQTTEYVVCVQPLKAEFCALKDQPALKSTRLHAHERHAYERTSALGVQLALDHTRLALRQGFLG